MKYILQMVVDESDWQNLTPDQMQPMKVPMTNGSIEARELVPEDGPS